MVLYWFLIRLKSYKESPYSIKNDYMHSRSECDILPVQQTNVKKKFLAQPF